MRPVLSSFIVLLVTLVGVTAFGYETTNMDCSTRRLPNVAEQVNAETNRRIRNVVRGLRGCNSERLMESMRSAIASAWSGNLETWAEDADIPKCRVPMNRSVYRDFTFGESPMGNMAGLNPVININGTYIGVDKLSHFMTEGALYWRMVRQGRNLRDILRRGVSEENGMYGIGSTGIRSYADMVANIRGFEFWRSFNSGANPYIKCEGGRWRQMRQFLWEDYVHAGMDESVNCNEYATPSMQGKVDNRSRELRRAANVRPLVCPYNPRACLNMFQNFRSRELSDTVISPRCRDAAVELISNPQGPGRGY